MYNHRCSFILNISTRWETIIELMIINSVLKNEKTIIRYIRQLKSRIDDNKSRNIAKILSHLKNLNFWIILKQARDILKSLHQIQYLSEAKNYSLSWVLHNWNKIQANLYFKAKKYSYIECLKDIADDIWELQLLQQSTSLHVVIALLLSQSHDIKVVDLTISLTFSSIMLIFFDRYSFCRSDAASVMKQWLAFQIQTDEFRLQVKCWRWIDYSKLFWPCCESFASQLAKLCLRINKISGNFVLAERNWSIMNLIKSKTRNQLSNVNADKLMYIYINERTLNRSRELKKRHRYTQRVEIDEEKLCEMKDRLLQEEIAMTGLNSSSENIVNEYLNSIDG